MDDTVVPLRASDPRLEEVRDRYRDQLKQRNRAQFDQMLPIICADVECVASVSFSSLLFSYLPLQLGRYPSCRCR